ncbi:hypothetical protein SHKM778_17750 [Streptomyces sp. KM77-8]|uniref:MFS transporter n=1 Tax=Streptomyces haneummycinicus TaxID=3074435 RepID=A0AAT9HD77_9ACTN
MASSEGSSSGDALSLADADGVGDADASSFPASFLSSLMTSRQAWYSSMVRLFAVGVPSLPSATASVGVNPMPMSTAVGIAARAITLPLGTWNLVNSGFLGAA